MNQHVSDSAKFYLFVPFWPVASTASSSGTVYSSCDKVLQIRMETATDIMDPFPPAPVNNPIGETSFILASDPSNRKALSSV